MDDVAADYAELVADLYATLLAAKLDGAAAIPEAGGSAEAGGSRLEAGGRTEAGGSRLEAGGRSGLPTAGGRLPQPPGHPPSRGGGDERSSRPPASSGRSSPPASSLQPPASSLLGKWAAVLTDPAQQLDDLRRELGERCAGCGGAVPYGEGPSRPRLVVLATPIAGAGASMFANMMVKVLNLEPSDAFVLPAPGCAACRDAVRRQVEIVRARLVLAMGREALAIVGGIAGGWSRWAGADALVTHHPDDILADAARKRPTFEHLQSLARRL